MCPVVSPMVLKTSGDASQPLQPPLDLGEQLLGPIEGIAFGHDDRHLELALVVAGNKIEADDAEQPDGDGNQGQAAQNDRPTVAKRPAENPAVETVDRPPHPIGLAPLVVGFHPQKVCAKASASW